MESHGRALAGLHLLAPKPSPDQLLARLADNESELVAICALLTDAVAAKGRITPAGEWLLDNFHLIEEQIRTTKRHLPRGYSRELPRLAEGPSQGRPRVYDLALQAIAHGDGRVDIAGLSRFIASYQTVTPLTLGELWAIPIMLRLAVIENLRRIGVRVAAAWTERRLAKFWSDAMTETASSDPKSLILVMADMARSNPLMTSPFVAELARRLQGRGPALAMSMTWIEQRLGELHLTIEQMVHSETQTQAASQVSVSNSIGSLRTLAAVDWRDFVESMSVVDRTLSGDPSGDYPMMDFATRDQYRHVAERVARRSPHTEVKVAELAVALARSADAGAGGTRPGSGHVGFYLVGKGLADLEAAAGIRLSPVEWLRRRAAAAPLLVYLGSIGALTVALTGGLVSMAGAEERSPSILLLFGLAAGLATSSLAVALVNWAATLMARPGLLPRMDFSNGIPEGARTLVVIPTLLSSARGLKSLVEGLEVRFLANRDDRLHFGLLTDFQDANQEVMVGDAALEAQARSSIEGLNAKYRDQRAGRADAFYLFHRPRRWNTKERVWMGYERKRGKLEDLNHLLRAGFGQAHPEFSTVVGDATVLSGVKYVITLDTDTELPREAARKFVGAMAHPLNRPHYDEVLQRVVEGYGILQPRVVIGLPSASRSRYARMCGGEPGLDPYTRTVSDVYQDLFAEGSFIGKGIYDVDAFEQALGGRFPENRILSHDLIEGCFARSGLLSDVQLVEDCPARYEADVLRRHRWIRGDWQIAGWLFRRSPLSRLSQWKLLDNLRRSLVPASLTALLVLGWSFGAASWFWTFSAVGILVLPALCASLADLIRKPPETGGGPHLRTTGRSLTRRLFQVSFEFACLPYEAYFSVDAIVRTLWRMGVSRTRLLEWSPSGHDGPRPARSRGGELVESYRSMGPAVVLSGLVAGMLAAEGPMKLFMAAPVLLLWFASPLFAWWLSLPQVRRRAALSGEQRRFLGMVSRRTWSFFETMVGPDDHWLPPDNYQESREFTVAHRTSPTNMGLSLLAHLAAYDFGYLLVPRLLERTERTLATMSGLERHRGHFLNWYDTETLEPLTPRYVSSVDSGNLAAHLLVLRSGLHALGGDPIVHPRLFAGLLDTFHLLIEATGDAILPSAEAFRAELDLISAAGPLTLRASHATLERLVRISTELEAELADPNRIAAAPPLISAGGGEGEGALWARSLRRHCGEALADLLFLAPWLLIHHGRLAPPLPSNPSLKELAGLSRRIHGTDGQPPVDATSDERAGWTDLLARIHESSERAAERLAALERLADQSAELSRMDFGFLYDKALRVFTVGYHVVEGRRDESFYDLLASEARLCSFVAIARGQAPQESWFALGRLLTNAAGEPVLLSWSGSMFEYLMPLLIMPEYEGTLLEQTGRAAVRRQIEYGKERGVAWGISESAYSTVDVHLNYQYRAFGVPGLGLKRGLADDLVIAPYASALALMVSPDEACRNLQRLAREGASGRFGFYESIDHTEARRHRDGSGVLVKTFMAHHQGMSLLALAYQILDRPMQKRFEADLEFQATLLLLQERIPTAASSPLTAQLAEVRSKGASGESPIRIFAEPTTEAPEAQLLSNGRYHVMVTNAGGGYSRFKDLAVTRWREDGVRDPWGTFCYLKEVESGKFWSATYQPTGARAKPESYEAVFSEGRAEFRRVDSTRGGAAFETQTEIVVSPEDDIELRRVRITNRSKRTRRIEITSYAEVVIAPQAADAVHPAFSNLFVETEILAPRRAILCTRRPRSRAETTPWMLHLMKVRGPLAAEVSYETDRSLFLGRGGSAEAPLALTSGAPLSGTSGSVLDPIVCIRSVISLDPGQSTTVDIVTGVAESRAQAIGLAERYQDRHLADRVFELGWTHSQVVRRQLNASEADAQLYARLAGLVIHASAAFRADPRILLRNRRGQSGLWAYAISGDLPIVLLRVADTASLDLVRQLVQAHAYWRLKGLAVDLVIWNEHQAGYLQQLQDQIMGLITSGVEAGVIDRPGGIFVRPAAQMSDEDGVLLQSVARVVLSDRLGSLAEQLDRRSAIASKPSPFKVTRTREPEAAQPLAPPNVILDNGLGGFTPDGREYVITLPPGAVTPAPWVNVLANPHFGTVVSEAGSAYTFQENAHEFRLTPWPNDPVSDPSGEAIYLRDEETGAVWSPTPSPAPAHHAYRVRHGFGYSVFELVAEGIRSELWIYADVEAPIKFSVLKLRNESGRPRKLSATGYVEWVLGDLREKSAMHVTTEVDPRSSALFARNPFNPQFSDRVAFFDAEGAAGNLTCDRKEFIGRNGSLRNPAALGRARLSGRVGAALDPCAAIQVSVDLSAFQDREIVFRLGVGVGAADATHLVLRSRGDAARTALEAVWNLWKETLGTVQVDTPDPALNVLANGWLVYQTLSGRMWARSGFYQSGGAFGFRDQLQDAMALIHTKPAVLREQLLLCASRQFREGDVQHWWHPPSGRGVRTRCSDDYLWLPLAVSRYVLGTGDTGVLDEEGRFLEGRPVNPEDDSYFDLPGRSADKASLYEHCVRAIRHGLRFGAHGLPLMGSGDWNDGMNLVGIRGLGESVWLGFFLCEVLNQFAEVARRRGDEPFAALCAEERARLGARIEEHAWDGEWYRRAYFDDGTPLGSAQNLEGRIDSISQSWSVLSGAGEPARSRRAMESVSQRLVRRKDALIQLLDPPFDKSDQDPGYIRGYVPGVRENGGQYTHAAIWATMAFAALGDRERAWELMRMINPANHGGSPERMATYKVEPYVVAADVYAVAPHVGRGGWTWYTGSAGWMYRLMLESLLGLTLEGNKLHMAPCVPADWPSYTVRYRYRETLHHIVISQAGPDEGEVSDWMSVTMDGAPREGRFIPLADDQREHRVEVRFRCPEGPSSSPPD